MNGIARAVGLVLAITGLALPASSELAAWDQEDAARLAREVVTELRAMLTAAEVVRQQPTVLQQRARDATFFQVRHTITALEELHSKLSQGWSRDETEAYARIVRVEGLRILEIYDDAEPDPKPLAHWEAAQRAGRSLARYYFD